MEFLRLLSTNEIIAQVISFLLLAYIMRALFWNKFLKAIDDRRDMIATEFKRIAEAQAEAERIKNDYSGRIDQIDKAARTKTEEAIAEGRRISDELRQGAEREAKELIENAHSAISDEISKAKETLKKDIIDISIGIAGKVIEDNIDEKVNRKILEEFLEKTGEV